MRMQTATAVFGFSLIQSFSAWADIAAGPQDSQFAEAYAEAEPARSACLAQLYAQCLDLAEPLARSGNPVAQNLLGVIAGVRSHGFYDPTASVEWFMRAGGQGYSKAFYNLGDFFEEEHPGLAPNSVLAVAAFSAAADLGYVLAYEDLGWHLLLGAPEVQDHSRALEFIALGQAAEPANTYFDGLLGDSLYAGLGQQADLSRALMHYERAAADGNAYAQFSAGYQYYFGEGVEMDDARALEWFTAAAAQDYPDAFGYIAESYLYGYAGGVDLDQAFTYAQRGDQLGDGLSAAHLGYMYLLGEGTAQDYVAARAAFDRGVERGNMEALYQLGDMAYFGLDQEVSYAQAFEIFQQVLVVEPDHGASNYSIGYMMMRGEGTDVDIPGSLSFIEASVRSGAENGYREAVVLYGHPDFAGPQSDPIRAMAFCLYSVENGYLNDLEDDNETLQTCAELSGTLDQTGLAAAAAIAETL